MIHPRPSLVKGRGKTSVFRQKIGARGEKLCEKRKKENGPSLREEERAFFSVKTYCSFSRYSTMRRTV